MNAPVWTYVRGGNPLQPFITYTNYGFTQGQKFVTNIYGNRSPH
jgi:hypothetical protein